MTNAGKMHSNDVAMGIYLFIYILNIFKQGRICTDKITVLQCCPVV